MQKKQSPRKPYTDEEREVKMKRLDQLKVDINNKVAYSFTNRSLTKEFKNEVKRYENLMNSIFKREDLLCRLVMSLGGKSLDVSIEYCDWKIEGG